MSWYDPKDASSALPEGWYQAVIEDISMGQTKKGGDMQIVAFRVYGGREIVLKEYFHAASLWKYKGLAKALGQSVAFNEGNFDAANFRNKPVDIELSIEEHPEYGEQNRIKGFASDGSKTGAGMRQPERMAPPAPGFLPKNGTGITAAIDHDDIPF